MIHLFIVAVFSRMDPYRTAYRPFAIRRIVASSELRMKSRDLKIYIIRFNINPDNGERAIKKQYFSKSDPPHHRLAWSLRKALETSEEII